jgi:GntR family transcriptional regulator
VAEEAELLGVPLHAPALLFERTTKDTTGRIVEYTRSIYRGDRYRITTHLTFDHNSG